MIYELKFSYYEDNSENNDEIIIAVYSSYKKAEIGKKKFSQHQDLIFSWRYNSCDFF